MRRNGIAFLDVRGHEPFRRYGTAFRGDVQMPAIRLTTKRVEKPWGRRDLWPAFESVPEGGNPVGEIWFEVPGAQDGSADGPELLIKYLFTSDRLSVQVHPDDAT